MKKRGRGPNKVLLLLAALLTLVLFLPLGVFRHADSKHAGSPDPPVNLAIPLTTTGSEGDSGTAFFRDEILFKFHRGLFPALFPGQTQRSDHRDNINIVFLGFDRTGADSREEELSRPDTIIVFSLDLKSNRVTLLSIPRDSYVEIAGTGLYDKINHAYSYGYLPAGTGEEAHQQGLQALLETIHNFLGGPPIHGFVALDMDAAAAVVDGIGGFHYDVDVEVRDLLGYGPLLVEPGHQRLDGQQFMFYVRNRADYQDGESGRMQRQQKILVALFNHLKNERRLFGIPELYSSLKHLVETDLSLAQVGALVAYAKDFDPAGIETRTFSGNGQLTSPDGLSTWYLVVDQQKRAEIVAEVFGLTVALAPAPDFAGGPAFPAWLDGFTPPTDDPYFFDPDNPAGLTDPADFGEFFEPGVFTGYTDPALFSGPSAGLSSTRSADPAAAWDPAYPEPAAAQGEPALQTSQYPWWEEVDPDKTYKVQPHWILPTEVPPEPSP